ncbi:MAG: eukaryotic-like serine/threonine-protein kinase [Verrucomicrobiota bacterium]
MNLETALGHRRRVEAFQKKHRTGLVSLLFTDIVGSTKLKQELGDSRAVKLLERHHALVRKVLSQFDGGEEISTAGDSFFLVFTRPSDAVKFSLLLQHQLRCLSERTGHEIADRIGLHVGEVIIAEPSGQTQKDLFGIQVDTCSRVSALAQGKQILMTRFAFDSARQALKGEELSGIGPLVWMNHGRYRLKGVEEPIELCAVGEQNSSAAATRPPSTEKGRRIENVGEEPVLGWRPAIEQQVPQTRWMLERMLGEGGFGEVWLARHQVLGDRCVFKFCFRADHARSLKREVTLFQVMRERFGAHPRIVSVRDVYFDEPPYYLAMDYCESLDLRAWCEARGGAAQVPIAVRLEIVAQVADALQAAHDAGVIHRDVKPGNILVSGDGSSPSNVQIKLTDFGIGQVVSDEVLSGLSRGGFTQTMSSGGGNGLTGTYLYMAPELIAGRAASAASDVYALGVVLYQMLMGDFTAPVTMDWTEEIKETQIRKELARCFSGQPKHRFERIDQLAQNLRDPHVSRPGVSAPVAVMPTVVITEPKSMPSRRPETSVIDLSPFYNAELSADWYNRAGHNLAVLARQGRIRAENIEFDPQGIIQVGCFQAEKLKEAYPQRVDGIPIGRKCRQLHFLHATLGRQPNGTQIGSYVVHYADGQQEIPLTYGEDLRSWLSESDPETELKRGTIAWTGRTTGLFLRSIRLFKRTWKNPRPGDEVISLDFQSVTAEGAPFLIGLTAD